MLPERPRHQPKSGSPIALARYCTNGQCKWCACEMGEMGCRSVRLSPQRVKFPGRYFGRCSLAESIRLQGVLGSRELPDSTESCSANLANCFVEGPGTYNF